MGSRVCGLLDGVYGGDRVEGILLVEHRWRHGFRLRCLILVGKRKSTEFEYD
jgi:hypothetical protein